jgi:hypothetical protein
MKVVINNCFGGFSLSMKAAEWLRDREHTLALEEFAQREEWDAKEREQGGMSIQSPGLFSGWLNPKGFMGSGWLSGIPRHDPLLLECLAALGDDANGGSAKLKVVDIPDDVEYTVEEYDGIEHIAEVHRTWA